MWAWLHISVCVRTLAASGWQEPLGVGLVVQPQLLPGQIDYVHHRTLHTSIHPPTERGG